MSGLPILILLYLTFRGDVSGEAIHLFVYLIAVSTAVTGYVLLKRHPDHIVKLRSEMERMLDEEAIAKHREAGAEDDMAAIGAYMDLIVEKLKSRVEAMEEEKERLQHQISQAQKVESLSIMASGLSHDLNNMLAAIIGNACIVMRGMREDSEYMEHARQIESTALRAIELASQIHTYAGKGRLSDEDIDITALVKELQETLKTASPKGVTIEFNLDGHIPCFPGDATHIRAAIMNLVLNAADATLHDKGTVTVTTGSMQCGREYLRDGYLDESLPEGKYVFVDVADTGPGIPSDVQDKMFDPFYTTKIRGRGLGLSVVLGVTRSHKGAVKFHSEQGKGTTFRLLFPCTPPRKW